MANVFEKEKKTMGIIVIYIKEVKSIQITIVNSNGLFICLFIHSFIFIYLLLYYTN